MHGYTHQYNSILNPWSAISGHDYEFWNIVENRPVDEDSVEWALGRLDNGLTEFHNSGYRPFAWETPHYQASPNSYRSFTQRFPVTYQRAVYYTSDNPDLNPANPNRDIAVGQFYPYAIYNDYYGQRIIPENLGNIEYEIGVGDPNFNNEYTAEDLIINASYALVIRDSFASFFFHPFLLEPEFGVPAMQDLDKIVKEISQLGYQWTDP